MLRNFVQKQVPNIGSLAKGNTWGRLVDQATETIQKIQQRMKTSQSR